MKERRNSEEESRIQHCTPGARDSWITQQVRSNSCTKSKTSQSKMENVKDDIAAYGSELMGEKETNRGASHETENFAFYS